MNHFKSHLLAFISHQIKTPLAIIKGHSSNLRNGLYGEIGGKAKDVLVKIEFAADELVNLVHNVIDLRRIEAGKMEYKTEDFDLRDLAKEVAEMFQPLAAAKKLELHLKVQGQPALVKGDRIHLKHAAQNLVDNAIKYTPKGFVKISVEARDNAAIFRVEDSGIGLRPDMIPEIFEEFVRDERVKKDIHGTGIGLYVVKGIIEAHGGKVEAHSEGEGRGSTFVFSLPMR